MKLPVIVTGLFIATGASLPACVAVAAPISPPPSLREAAGAPVETVEQRRSRAPRRYLVAPPGYDDPYRAYGYWPGHGSDDWSHWIRSYHPGWP